MWNTCMAVLILCSCQCYLPDIHIYIQDVYHTTHQCFYSKRSMYLALFRLCDGEAGIEELEQWLRNVQVCIVTYVQTTCKDRRIIMVKKK